MSYACCLFGETPAPRRWMSASTGFGTLGYALPAAIGAKLAAPERPSLCLIGDGGLHYTLPELAAAADAGAPIIVVLWNDRRYAEIETYMLTAGAEPTGVALYATDFAAAAKAFGCDHAAPTSLAEFEAVLSMAAGRERSTVIELDASHYVF
jgi:acetolactate synthase-1/2/3 large subunit